MSHSNRSFKFSILLLISGFCGISYEILYARILGNLIGDQFAVSASVLLTFLLGIGFGTLAAHRLKPWVWLIEAAIGLFGILFVLNITTIDHFLYTHVTGLGTDIGVMLIVSILLIALPAFLVGVSLPIFAHFMQQLSDGEPVFAKTYAIYNLGAASTVLFIEFVLIRSLGITYGTFVIASLNLLVAISLRWNFADLLQNANKHVMETVRFPGSLKLALITVSIASAVYQLLMIKQMEFLFGPFRETFAYVLFMILIGISLGSALVRWFKLDFSRLILLNLIGLTWSIAGFSWVVENYAHFYSQAAEALWSLVILKLLTTASLILLPALTFGATIPALMLKQSNVAKESGHLLFISSMANVVGFLLMAFVFHQYLDYYVILLVVAGLSLLSLCIYSHRINLSVILATCLVMASGTSAYTLWDEELLYFGYTSFHSSKKLERKRNRLTKTERFKGPQDTFSIIWHGGKPYFFINGYTSIPLDAPSEKLVGAFTSLYSPRLDEALVLGVGSGATAATVSKLFKHTEAVEINAVALDNLFRMKKFNFDIEQRAKDGKIDIFHDDAIHYVKATDKTYSLIVNTVTTPLYFSSSKLYTYEFLSAVKQRLRTDGVYMTWIDSRVGDDGMNIMLKTLTETFDHCGIATITNSYFLLICSAEPIQAYHPLAVADNQILNAYFKKEYALNPRWLSFGLLHPRAKDLVGDGEIPLNTLDNPVLEYKMARLLHRGYPEFQRRLRNSMNEKDLAEAFVADSDWNLARHARYLDKLHRSSSFSRRMKSLGKAHMPDFKTAYASAGVDQYEQTHEIGKTARSLYRYGSYLKRQKHYSESVVAFKQALQIDPSYNNAYFNMGASYEYLGENKLALEAFYEEQRIDPNDSALPYRLGRLHVKLKQYPQAVTLLEQSLKHNPSSRNWYYMGLAYEGVGQNKQAITAFKRAISKNKSNSAARKSMEHLQQLENHEM